MRLPARPIFSAAAGALLLLAGGCASPTPYQPVSSTHPARGGYTDRRLAEDRYEVTFAGNMLTSRERVENYLLFRASELTLEHGYDWFQVIDHEMDHEIRREIRPDPFYRPWYGTWRPYWRYRTVGMGWTAGIRTLATRSSPTMSKSARLRSSRRPPRSSLAAAPFLPATENSSMHAR